MFLVFECACAFVCLCGSVYFICGFFDEERVACLLRERKKESGMRNRERDRETARERDRETARERDRETARERETETERQSENKQIRVSEVTHFTNNSPKS